MWLSSGPSAPWHTPGQPGVTIRAYADLHRIPAHVEHPGANSPSGAGSYHFDSGSPQLTAVTGSANAPGPLRLLGQPRRLRGRAGRHPHHG
ncbi:DUF6207 family protein [Streptomyces lydicus]|uniref:DUF6207 family protein n=1 Tax=Streptomyces lydicus TaxID=47763 RepID=UPI003418ED56